jgi:hypothetical protein
MNELYNAIIDRLQTRLPPAFRVSKGMFHIYDVYQVFGGRQNRVRSIQFDGDLILLLRYPVDLDGRSRSITHSETVKKLQLADPESLDHLETWVKYGI